MSRDIPDNKKVAFVDFGAVDRGGRRITYEFHLGDGDAPRGNEAYDIYMGGRYVLDAARYDQNDAEGVFHPEDLRDQTRKFAALLACQKPVDGNMRTYFEVGSSVMGVIQGLDYVNRHSGGGRLDTRGIKFRGVDNSVFMNHVAMLNNGSHDVKVWNNVRGEPENLKSDLFWAKGVSLMYAFDDPRMMVAPLINSQIAVFDYTFSKGDRIKKRLDTGIDVNFLGREEVESLLKAVPGKVLFSVPYQIKKYNDGGDRETLDLVYGDAEVVNRYFSELEKMTGENKDNYGDPRFIREEDRVVLGMDDAARGMPL